MGITTINNQLAITLDVGKMKNDRAKRMNTLQTLITNSDKGITFLEPEKYEEFSGELSLLNFLNDLEYLLFTDNLDLSSSDRQLVEQEYRRFLVIDEDYKRDLDMLLYLSGRDPLPPMNQTAQECF